MKKIIVVLFSGLMVLTSAGCASNGEILDRSVMLEGIDNDDD